MLGARGRTSLTVEEVPGTLHVTRCTVSRAQGPGTERQWNYLDCQAGTTVGVFHVLTHLNPLSNPIKLLLACPPDRGETEVQKN